MRAIVQSGGGQMPTPGVAVVGNFQQPATRSASPRRPHRFTNSKSIVRQRANHYHCSSPVVSPARKIGRANVPDRRQEAGRGDDPVGTNSVQEYNESSNRSICRGIAPDRTD